MKQHCSKPVTSYHILVLPCVVVDDGILLTAPTRSKPASPQPHSRPTSQSSGSSVELRPIGSRSTTPCRSLNEGSNDNLCQYTRSGSQELLGSATRTTTPNTSPNPMHRFSRTAIHPMVGAGLTIREAFGEYLLKEVQLTLQTYTFTNG